MGPRTIRGDSTDPNRLSAPEDKNLAGGGATHESHDSETRTSRPTSNDGRMPTQLPSLSSRLANVDSSVVRDILELTQQPEVISFAGGLPTPEMFPAELVAQALATVLAP